MRRRALQIIIQTETFLDYAPEHVVGERLGLRQISVGVAFLGHAAALPLGRGRAARHLTKRASVRAMPTAMSNRLSASSFRARSVPTALPPVMFGLGLVVGEFVA